MSGPRARMFAGLLGAFALASCAGSAAGTGGSPAAPTIASFTASPSTVPAGGGPVVLGWQVGGADTVSIDHGVGTVTGGSVTVTVSATTTFRLTATNSAGATTATATVTVAAPGVPVISGFTASPATLPAGGGSTTLSWQVSGADTVAIDGGVGVVTGQSVTVTVSATTTFRLTATSPAGTATASTTVTVAAALPPPVIASFSASPATLPAGGGAVTLSWQVRNATTVSIDRGVGGVTGPSVQVNVAATTIFTLTAANESGTASASTTVVVGTNPWRSGTRFVAIVTPVAGESFTAPATLRLIAAGRDPNVDTNYPVGGKGGNASRVQFFVDDAVVLEVDGSQAEYWVFKGFVGNVAAGVHRVWARATYVNPAQVLDSLPVLVRVDAPPAYGQVVDLSADLAVTGASHALVGTPSRRVRVNGNGHRIFSSVGTTTAMTFQYVDFFDVGDRSSTSTPGVDLVTSGPLVVENCTFDGSNTVQLAVEGSGTASVRGNTFRSNMRQPLGQYPDGKDGGSWPVVVLRGGSTGSKAFQGNNAAAGWILLLGTRRWLVGGDGDADSNVLIGARVGVYADGSPDLQIRRNYSHHVYYGGWSQGSNFELGGIPSLSAEHNVIAGSSWPVRGVASEFRYNLVLEAGHEWLWADHSGAWVHHNVFVGGDADIGGIYALYAPQGVRIENNTFDGQSGGNVVAAVLLSSGSTSLTSNLFLNVPRSPVRVEGGILSADFNLFWNSGSPAYSDGRAPPHDVLRDPLLRSPASVLYDFDEGAVWTRTLTVRQILAQYRDKYTPGTGSPAIDAGDPAGGAGNDIGAVGAGVSNPADLFGK
jgi:hypothetical protein